METVMTVTDQQSTPMHATLVQRAFSLQPLLREHALAGETHRQAADEVIAALTNAGMFRLGQPTGLGGYEAGARPRLAVTEVLGEADGSAAWLIALASDAGWILGRAPERLQQEVFQAGPNVRLAGSLTPVHGRRVEGGLRVTGRWPTASGAPHAMWIAITVLI